MSSWSEEIIQKVDSKLEGVRDKEIRFFRIDEFKRNIKRVDEFSRSCPECKKEMINISEVVSNLEAAINTPGKKRREYDRLISRLSKHMQKTHGFFPPYHFTYLISFLGMIAGSVLGFFLVKINPEMKVELFSLGFALGLFPTYVWGHLKDKKIRTEKRLM